MSKQCLYCTALIVISSSQSANKKFCSPLHKKYYHRKAASLKTRSEQKRANLPQNDEILYLVKQCIYAGTVQILSGHNLESFIETMSLVKNRPRCEVDLCHISPVKGRGKTGLFHCRNLVYCGRHQNRKFGNRHHSGGLFILNSELSSEWAVHENMPVNDILHLIEKYLGDIIPKYLKSTPVRKSKKAQLALKIMEHESSSDFNKLMLWSQADLKDKLTECSGVRTFKHMTLVTGSKFKVYVDGLTRFIDYGVANEASLIELKSIMVIGYMALSRIEYSATDNWDFYLDYEPFVDAKYGQAMLKDPKNWSVFKDLLYEAAFDALHGAPLNVKRFRKEVMSFLYFPDRAWRVTLWKTVYI